MGLRWSTFKYNFGEQKTEMMKRINLRWGALVDLSCCETKNTKKKDGPDAYSKINCLCVLF